MTAGVGGGDVFDFIQTPMHRGGDNATGLEAAAAATLALAAASGAAAVAAAAGQQQQRRAGGFRMDVNDLSEGSASGGSTAAACSEAAKHLASFCLC